jgi:hypothetical protein
MAIKHILVIVEDCTDQSSQEMVKELENASADTDVDIFLIDRYESAISVLHSLQHPSEESTTLN